MEKYLNESIDCIQDPDAIYVSDQKQDRHVYFKLLPYPGMKRLHLKIIVDTSFAPAEIRSAWLQKSISGGIGGLIYVKAKL